MASRNELSGNNSAIVFMGLGLDVLILIILALIQKDLDSVAFAFASLIVGWMLGITVLKTYHTRKPKKKLILFLIVHLLPLPIALYIAHFHA